MPIYLKFGDIKGNVTSGEHKDWIECTSYSWGVARPLSMAAGAGTNREDGATPSISEIVLTKTNDDASTLQVQEALTGESVTAVVRFVMSSKGGALQCYLEQTLDECLISSYSRSSGGDRPQESFSLNFTKFLEKYIKFSGENKIGTPLTAGYDLKETKNV